MSREQGRGKREEGREKREKRKEKREVRDIIDKCQEITECEIEVKFDEPMALHTTFKAGGPADCYVKPSGDKFPEFCTELLKRTREEKIPVFILGGGANIVVSDNGIRGIVLDTSSWSGLNSRTFTQFGADLLILKSGTTMDDAAEYALEEGLTGLEFLAGMPGTIGGAVYMNARCYGKEIADILVSVEYIFNNSVNSVKFGADNKKEFDYKKSPFQKMDCLILSAAFKLEKGVKEKIKTEMEKNRQDRKEKGHYLYPCAGSAFKNNRDFGKPSGQIIDELGLRGYSIGDAQVAPFHGNIVINTGNAKAADIKALMSEVAAKVKIATGFILESEIIFVG